MAAILATWGVSLILQHGMQLAFGVRPRKVDGPVSGAVDVLGSHVPGLPAIPDRCHGSRWSTTILVMPRTAFGLDLRAVIQDRDMAEPMGIDTRRMFAVAFGTGTALAALAGRWSRRWPTCWRRWARITSRAPSSW